MKKKEYMKPAMRTVQTRNRQQILTGSRTIQVKNSSYDNDDPSYDGNSSGSIWDAN